jgi:molybdate transport system substrate-binding protein
MPAGRHPMTYGLQGISSMATRRLLAALCADYRERSGVAVAFEAAGGVEVPRRLREGESFDLVVLAARALQGLADEGLVVPASLVPFAVSPAALAVRAGSSKPGIGSDEALLQALRAAACIGYSTGPSGDALLQWLERAGVLAELRARLLRAPPGVPVASLLAEGKAEIGLQQLSELAGVDGVEVVGPLPAAMQLETVFSGAVCARSRQPEQARAFLAFIGSAAADAAIGRAFMSPYRDSGGAGATAT